MKKFVWLVWGIVTLSIVGFFAYTLLQAENKDVLLIGDATYGHYQIELACDTCHTDAFGGPEVIQGACEGCHQAELDAAHDSHPKKKFTDPRNADRLEILDARFCTTCHTEHQKEQTHAMGLTIPEDYCFHCHQEIGEERKSHEALGYESCASAGCHNYHDNRALYEKFLVEHANEPWLKAMDRIIAPAAVSVTARAELDKRPHLQVQTDKPHQDSSFYHAAQGVGCQGCHRAANEAGPGWVAAPGVEVCAQCHVSETEGYQSGRHGMRLAQGMPALRPEQTSGVFRDDASHYEHGCNSCHVAHDYDADFAGTGACLTCHADDHSLAYSASPHASLENRGMAEKDVSCATCHMPATAIEVNGEQWVSVEHNQNLNLRPNEKMIRSVCMDCHGVQFALNALADETLIRNNFSGQPDVHIPSIEWALERDRP